MKIEKIENLIIPQNSFVKFTQMGNITEIQHNTHRNSKSNIQRLSKDELLVIATGEVRQVIHYEDRTDDMKSVARSLKNLRDLINCNITDVSRAIWFTLTYRDNMTDPNKLYTDFKKFNMRLKYWEQQNGIPFHDYIICAEPQGRGAWHIHGLLLYPEKAPYIPHDIFWRLWSKQGFKQREIDGKGYDYVYINSLKDVDNIGAYLTAYLGDMSLEEYKTVKPNGHWQGMVKEIDVVDHGKSVKKKYLKGARLHFYPAGFRLYRCSRGVNRPTSELIPYSEAKQKVSAVTLTFKKSVKVTDTNGYTTTLTTFYYNRAVYDKKMKRINSIIIFVQILSRGFEENERYASDYDIGVYEEHTGSFGEEAETDTTGTVFSRLSGRRLL